MNKRNSNAADRLLATAALILASSVVPMRPLAAAEDWDIQGPSLGGRASRFDPRDGREGTWYGGGQLRLQGKIFGLEGSFDYRSVQSGDRTVRTYPLQLSLLGRLAPGSRVTPMVLLGAGWYYTSVRFRDIFGADHTETDNRFGLHAGFGLQFFLNRYWSFDSTYRRLWIETFESKDQNVADKFYRDNGHMLTFALNYHF